MSLKTQSRFPYRDLIINIAIPLIIGVTASLFTEPEIKGWYLSLNKPTFNPPNWLFAPVWTTIYLLIGIAAFRVWRKRESTAVFKNTIIVYAIQLVLNFSWSIVFFGMHQVLGACLVIVALWISILLNMYFFGKFSRTASWLLLPYLLWVSFASTLNLAIYLLNR